VLLYNLYIYIASDCTVIIEINEKNFPVIKKYLRENPDVRMSDFSSIKDVKRMSVAPVCPYWCPIVPEEIEIKKFNDLQKIKYIGLNNQRFIIHQRKKGCRYYNQHEAYADADVIIFNSSKYKLETLLNRKPETELEIIDECDEFLDGFANQEQINLNRLLFSLSNIFTDNKSTEGTIQALAEITKKLNRKLIPSDEIYEVKGTPVEELILTFLKKSLRLPRLL